MRAKSLKNKLTAWLVLMMVGPAAATPSTQIWNPSADIQARGVWHLGVDDYFTIDDTASGGWQAPTNLGITYGLIPGFELGADIFLPQAGPGNPFALNAKYGIAESELKPALAVGGFGFGWRAGATDQNVLYGVVAKSLAIGRISAGYFSGNAATIGADNKGIILSWDKTVNDKLWFSLDYASGNSSLGAVFAGFSWLFSPNTPVIFAYGLYNNGAKPTVTTQLDINI